MLFWFGHRDVGVQYEKTGIERVRAAALPHAASKVAPHVTPSIRVHSVIPAIGGSPAVLVKKADEALYNTKGERRNTARCSDPNAGDEIYFQGPGA
jgi:PleD family two-component response regulator